MSIVVAVDGNNWRQSIAEVADGLCCDLRLGDWQHFLVDLQSLSRSGFSDYAGGNLHHGLQRIRYGLAKAPHAVFDVEIRVPHIGTVRTSSAVLPGRVTDITLIVRPDGTTELNQKLLPLPGETIPPDELPLGNSGPLGYGRLLRLLHIGQKLHGSGDLLAQAIRGDSQDESIKALRTLLQGEWVDPLLSCMAYYAGWRASAEGRPVGLVNLPAIAGKLEASFVSLPDVRIVAALESNANNDPQQLAFELSPILDDGWVPLLLESAQHLATLAVRIGREDAAIVDRVRRARPGQTWCESVTSEHAAAAVGMFAVEHSHRPQLT